LLQAQGISPLDPLTGTASHPGVDFTLRAGTITVLQGPSGCGKSRLLRALADLDPSSGKVFFSGRTKDHYQAPTWRRQVVYLAAESGWWEDHVKAHFPPSSQELAQTFLNPLGLPPDALDWEVSRASTGERQRLALLRALTLPAITQPRVYLLDEPTAALDPATTLKVEQLLRQVISDRPQTACLMVSHLPEQAQRLADFHLTLSTNGALQGEQR
jgi:ABC-type iron transport system FetAB ATPase subunit